MMNEKQTLSAIKNSYNAEYSGLYENGLEELGFWNVGEPISLREPKHLELDIFGELLLRSGVLYGYYKASDKKSQETSRDLINKALKIFSDLDSLEMQASCASYLALTYWRAGEFDEAKALLSNSRALYSKGKIFLRNLIFESLVAISERNYEHAATTLRSHSQLFGKCEDRYLRANYFSNLGIADKGENRTRLALSELKEARLHFGILKHRQFEACTENNIARLFLKNGKHEEALRHASDGLEMAKSANTGHIVGQIINTMAEIVLEQGHYANALELSKKAINELRRFDAHNALVDAMETRIKALFATERIGEMLELYAEAIYIARTKTSGGVTVNLTELLAELFRKSLVLKVYAKSETADEPQFFDMDIPRHLQGRRLGALLMDSEHLSHRGVEKGDFVIYRDNQEWNAGGIEIAEYDGEIYAGDTKYIAESIKSDLAERSQTFLDSEFRILGIAIGYCKKPKEDNRAKFIQFEKSSLDSDERMISINPDTMVS